MFVSGCEVKTNSDDGRAGHSGGKDGDRLLRQRFREYIFRKFLLYAQRYRETVDGHADDARVQFDADKRDDEHVPAESAREAVADD